VPSVHPRVRQRCRPFVHLDMFVRTEQAACSCCGYHGVLAPTIGPGGDWGNRIQCARAALCGTEPCCNPRVLLVVSLCLLFFGGLRPWSRAGLLVQARAPRRGASDSESRMQTNHGPGPGGPAAAPGGPRGHWQSASRLTGVELGHGLERSMEPPLPACRVRGSWASWHQECNLNQRRELATLETPSFGDNDLESTRARLRQARMKLRKQAASVSCITTERESPKDDPLA
jgi:hypothetical protein